MAERKPAKRKKPRAPAKPKDEVLDAASRKARDIEIFRAWMRGLGVPTLAATYGLSERTIQRSLAEKKLQASDGLLTDTAEEVLVEHLLRIEGLLDELATRAAQEKGSAGVSAVLGKLAVLKEKREVLQEVGVLPHDLGTMHVKLDVQRIAAGLIAIFEEFDVPPEAARAAKQVIAGTGRELEPAA